MSNLTTDCIIGTGSIGSSGYYRVSHGGKLVLEHRLAFSKLHNKPIYSLTDLDHICKNKWCINPEHLEEVTAGQNIRRAKGTDTHCVAGHERTKENYIRLSTGKYACVVCRSISLDKANQERKELANKLGVTLYSVKKVPIKDLRRLASE